jgi:hypothetical protein
LIPDLKHFFNFASKKNGEFFREWSSLVMQRQLKWQ